MSEVCHYYYKQFSAECPCGYPTRIHRLSVGLILPSEISEPKDGCLIVDGCHCMVPLLTSVTFSNMVGEQLLSS